MSRRVVVYAEGGRETGVGGPYPRPHEVLDDDQLGPAHVLVRRSMHAVTDVPEAAIRFLAGLRLGARVPRGADLLDRRNLRQLCTYLSADTKPDLTVIFVDADRTSGRQRDLEAHVEGLAHAPIIAVAVQEFEAWLIADGPAVSQVTGGPGALDGDLESLDRRAAKEHLNAVCSRRLQADPGLTDRDLRISIARTVDLAVIRHRCASFDRFVRALEKR